MRSRNDPHADKTLVKPPRPGDALSANVAGATDGLVYRLQMSTSAGRPYAEHVYNVAFPGPFQLITPHPQARLPLLVPS